MESELISINPARLGRVRDMSGSSVQAAARNEPTVVFAGEGQGRGSRRAAGWVTEN